MNKECKTNTVIIGKLKCLSEVSIGALFLDYHNSIIYDNIKFFLCLFPLLY